MTDFRRRRWSDGLGSLARELDRSYISRYEAGILEPPLQVLLRYAEVAGVHLEVLADDEILLPSTLPCRPKSAGIRRDLKHGSKGRKSTEKK